MDAFLICKRCGHGKEHPWKRRTIGKLPVACPKCHRTDWNKENVLSRPRTQQRVIPERKETVTMVELHNVTCDCTSCLLARGLL